MIQRRAKWLTLVTSAAVCAAPMAALAAETDLVGARASSGESQLESRGYVFITGNEGEYDTKHSYYWRASDKKCVHVETYDGRYTAVTDASASDCHQKSGDGNAAAAVGVVAGAVILGALLSHKSHHHENNQHLADQQAEAQYERGYNDGLHNVAYHNYDRADSYADGYSAGVKQREINTSYHHGRGGYAQVAQFGDLTGARGSSADSALNDRGFRNVDGFKSGDASYTIWWRGASRQCLQMIVAQGRVEDIRDIGEHPKCR